MTKSKYWVELSKELIADLTDEQRRDLENYLEAELKQWLQLESIPIDTGRRPDPPGRKEVPEDGEGPL